MNSSGFSISRCDPRTRLGVPGRLRYGWKHSAETKASIVDISKSGMCVHCEAQLGLGMEVKAILGNAREDLKLYRVVWFRKTESSDHGFIVGLELKPPRIAES